MSFFQWFSLSSEEFEPIIGEWVEKVLNCKVLTTLSLITNYAKAVEEVLNCKVSTTELSDLEFGIKVEEALTKT
jgi:hypothetical protein